MTLRIGTAGWSLPRQWHPHFDSGGSHLERYAARFSGVEINSSFYRQHKRTVYARWAASVPDHFRFSVKLPRAITHDQSLVATDVMLDVFLDEIAGLGNRLGPLLVQLPPSLSFRADIATEFFELFRRLYSGDIACEPRHPSWFEADGDALLRKFTVARVAADPSCVPAAETPGGWNGLKYFRLHGSPRMYYSAYQPEQLETVAAHVHERECECWCMFDNTASGAATGDAIRLLEMTSPSL